MAFVESFGSNVEAAHATKAVGVMDAQGAYWWNGKQADLKYIWEAHEKASSALLEQQSQTPEDLMIQRLPDKSRRPFRDPTAISWEMEQGINNNSMWALWNTFLSNRAIPFLLMKATDELPPFPSEQKPKSAAKCYAAFAVLTGVVTSLYASKGGNDTTLWTELWAAS